MRRGQVPSAIVAMVLLASACTGGGDTGSVESPHWAGGTLRVGVITNPAQGSCGLLMCGAETDDPQIEYSVEHYELERCCLTRTLLSYNGEDSSHGGGVLRPDLASALPSVSSDG